ncbi:complex I intermediate-associated protein 30, mitochondrial-like isoform X1 [Pollicipes pollicipes]|nr:complex I intermediate-associated protein 30, mitochondrial-like isoform X2 [Pollicipes pollicipes]XP_037081707.1 complex I intermediate-associated protein 30, mitochondrial-like isoform X2 [Pollicipes pollicipes]XP_037081708.1 complex I intermediate-associated protein 30, mitochondrial-like isoform X2 [Pollicipes pollicipes]XP_037081709.1 complex I intermediate-associated protein 30, mitochondrial-like isoform X2 [Pollicipes pollicipes]XP_037081710.1 complex I intermediate-associated protei
MSLLGKRAAAGRKLCSLVFTGCQEMLVRQLRTTVPVFKFWERDIKAEYGRERKTLPDKQMVVDGLKELKHEVGVWKDEFWNKFTKEPLFLVRPGEVDTVFQLNSEAALERWIVTADRDNSDGQSQGELVLGRHGKAVLRGTLDTTPPKDGSKQRAGYCNMRCLRPQKSFKRDGFFDWSAYTHVVLRVRGDGRSYMLNLASMGYFDLMWNDMYSFPLYTRGGPYWQVSRIPFSKFFLSSKGRIQDKQCPLMQDRITSIGITAAGVSGPFQLEIDYIGLEMDPKHDEEFAYEMYKTPSFIAGV